MVDATQKLSTTTTTRTVLTASFQVNLGQLIYPKFFFLRLFHKRT